MKKNIDKQTQHLIQTIQSQCSAFNSRPSSDNLAQIKNNLLNPEPNVRRAVLYGLLSIRPELRESWMVESIMKFTKHYEFFKKYSSKHQECARFLRSAHFKARSEIVQYQSDPDQFFFILQGQALVFLKKTMLEMEGEKSYKKENPNAPDLEYQDKQYLSKNHILSDIAKFKKISLINQGASFGELGILYNRPRIALIVAKTDCMMATLNKQQYLSIFCEIENQERKFKRDFIFGNFFAKFNQLKYELCQAILYSFREKKYTINQWIFKEGDPFQGFYLIKSGEASIISNISPRQIMPGLKYRQISIVGQGYFLCYEEWRASIQNGAPCKLKYSAKVNSAELKVYTLSYTEMEKIYNFRTILKEISSNVSYAKYLESEDLEQKRLNEQVENSKPEPDIDMGDVKQRLVREKEEEAKLKRLMLESILGCDRSKVQLHHHTEINNYQSTSKSNKKTRNGMRTSMLRFRSEQNEANAEDFSSNICINTSRPLQNRVQPMSRNSKNMQPPQGHNLLMARDKYQNGITKQVKIKKKSALRQSISAMIEQR